ncbi:hypothetical protein, partial [Brooklawnia cerclae]
MRAAALDRRLINVGGVWGLDLLGAAGLLTSPDGWVAGQLGTGPLLDPSLLISTEHGGGITLAPSDTYTPLATRAISLPLRTSQPPARVRAEAWARLVSAETRTVYLTLATRAGAANAVARTISGTGWVHLVGVATPTADT